MNHSRAETRIVLTPAQHFTVSKAPAWTLCISQKLTIFPRGGYADGGLWALRAEPGRALGPPAHRAPRHCPSRLRAEELPSGKLGSRVPPISSAGKGGGLSSPLPFVRAGERARLLVHCFFPSSPRQGFPSLKGYRLACDSAASTEPPPPTPAELMAVGGRGFPCVPPASGSTPRDPRFRPRSRALPDSVPAGLCRPVRGVNGPVRRRRVCCPYEAVPFAPKCPGPSRRAVSTSQAHGSLPARVFQG